MVLCVFFSACRGHTSYVNCAVYTKDSSNTILTGSSDGTIKLWDLRSTECLLTTRYAEQCRIRPFYATCSPRQTIIVFSSYYI